MSFDSASDFLLLAAKKYKLGNVATASWMCEKVRKIIVQKYPEFSAVWEPVKFDSGVLSICVKNSTAGSELFLRTNELLEEFDKNDFRFKISQIQIVRK
ncbi:DUF721 domain-containing protein [bacterium]|jgi:hypothetical protein|nr:DUF721 domain-containing protein [bacterium]MBT6831613.1 DUF721 domain-containing protein [bacterium]MBT6996258.1 DUF721 domain-containing protein [bacterium]MBT7772936.1 DUF721 domain-containing protein [bacterium]